MIKITDKNKACELNLVSEGKRGQPNLTSCEITLVNTKYIVKII